MGPPAKAASLLPSLVFGIYPGGAAGTVGPSGPIAPEDPVSRLAALERLRGGASRGLMLHIYTGYTGPGGYDVTAQVGKDISQYTAAGFQVEIVLCYRPVGPDATTNVSGFVGFVRQAVRELGPNPNVVSLQITNEANISGAPNASDGYYQGAQDALIQGVIAAKSEAELDGFPQISVGFNWAYDTGSAEAAFWRYLPVHGGESFVSALDWVGFDAYPGTWGPALPRGRTLAARVRQATVNGLTALRQTYMPLAGIPTTVPLRVTESGYPTGPKRTTAMQSTVLSAAVRAVNDYRGIYNVSNYDWFALRDGDSSSTSLEAQYGLMYDNYAPKPAFATYQQLIASLGAPS